MTEFRNIQMYKIFIKKIQNNNAYFYRMGEGETKCVEGMDNLENPVFSALLYCHLLVSDWWNKSSFFKKKMIQEIKLNTAIIQWTIKIDSFLNSRSRIWSNLNYILLMSIFLIFSLGLPDAKKNNRALVPLTVDLFPQFTLPPFFFLLGTQSCLQHLPFRRGTFSKCSLPSGEEESCLCYRAIGASWLVF